MAQSSSCIALVVAVMHGDEAQLAGSGNVVRQIVDETDSAAVTCNRSSVYWKILGSGLRIPTRPEITTASNIPSKRCSG